MAIYDEPSPVLVTVFCDECGIEETNDYMVPAGVDSLDTARHHMATQLGWMISKVGDVCPPCFKGLAQKDAGFQQHLKHNERVWSK